MLITGTSRKVIYVTGTSSAAAELNLDNLSPRTSWSEKTARLSAVVHNVVMSSLEVNTTPDDVKYNLYQLTRQASPSSSTFIDLYILKF